MKRNDGHKEKEPIEYENYQRAIYSQAWNVKKRYPQLELDELIGQGNIAFAEAKKSFDPKRGAKFSTWLHWVMRKYIPHCPVYGLHYAIEEDTAGHYVSPGEDFILRIHSLSPEAKAIVDLILNSPEELVEGYTKDSIKKTLRAKGWKWPEIRKARNELRKEFS